MVRPCIDTVCLETLVIGYGLASHAAPSETELEHGNALYVEPFLLVHPPCESEGRELRPFVRTHEFGGAVETVGGRENVAMLEIIDSAAEEGHQPALGLAIAEPGIGSRIEGSRHCFPLSHIGALDGLGANHVLR